MRTLYFAPLALAAALCLDTAAPGSCVACPSDLDPAFGSDGISQTDIGPGYGSGFSVFPLASGGILVSGIVTNDSAILRYDEDGKLDTTFGSDGVARLDSMSGFPDIDVTESGAIVAGGATGNDNSQIDFMVARFDSAGLPDLSFGLNGGTTTRIGPGNSWIRGVVLLGDGRLVAVGQSRANTFEWQVTVACYDGAGKLDPDFGNGGIVTFSPNGLSGIATGVARVENDSVVISLYTGDTGETGVAKLLSNGEFDPSFGNGGIRVSPSGDYEEAWAIGTDLLGRIYVGGNSASISAPARKARLFVRRYLPDGKPDLAYGRRGKAGMTATHDLAGRALAVSSEGIATVVGSTGKFRRGLLARFSSDGQRDVTFGRHGLARLSVDGGASLWGAALDEDGRLLVTGSSEAGPLLARYQSEWDGNGQCVIGCGDGVLSRFEQCDDGNIANGDGCSAACFLE